MATDYVEFTLAAVQAAPILFDRDACTDKACRLIEQAADKGATLAAFGEVWLGGYPFWTFTTPGEKWWKAAAEYLANAVEIPSPTTDRLCTAAKRAGIDLAIGVVELDSATRGTVYCTLLFIGREGKILGRHRKLKPTCVERTIWGEGDAAGLHPHERPYGRISGLNCWEHNMVLPGYALMAQGTQIHVATWPGREPPAPPGGVPLWPRQLLLSRAFASQAGCYVIAVGGMRRAEDTPERYRDLSVFHHSGDSYIIDPRGEVIAGPAEGETILTARGSLEAVLKAKAVCDVGGHYSRPDVFQLLVHGQPAERVVQVSDRNGAAAPEASGAGEEPGAAARTSATSQSAIGAGGSRA